MLSREDNEYVTRVGPGTPMGELMRHYWIPALISEDLPEPDGNPLRVRLLNEDLIAFRDSAGKVGLVGNHCPHRGASLYFGRNEENGLRCVYHGWKFDVSGACVDMPNEPPESNFKDKVRHLAYPCVERNGVIWTYMGPAESPPDLPEIGWSLVPASQRSSLRYLRECNWLQALEGDIDSSHVNFLHSRLRLEESLQSASPMFYRSEEDRKNMQFFRSYGAPVLFVSDTQVGVTYGARRPADDANDFWRVTQFMLPFHTSIPGPEVLGSAKVWVPIDDENTMVWEPHWSLTGKDLSDEERTGKVGRIPSTGFLPNSPDPLGRWRFAANKANDYLLDRTVQRGQNYTGLDECNPLQDGAVQEGMGAIFDRSTEHLGTTDAMIIRVRRRLLEAARALRERNALPPGADAPDLFRRRGVQMVLPKGADWLNTAEERVGQVTAA